MDKMDGTWERFKNPFLRICIGKIIYLSERVNGKVRIVLRISCKFVYYLVIAILAYILTREGGDYYAEFSLLDTEMDPPFGYRLAWAFLVFLIFNVMFWL